MKEDEVPQEDENKLYEGKNRLLEYAVDKDGSAKNQSRENPVGGDRQVIQLQECNMAKEYA